MSITLVICYIPRFWYKVLFDLGLVPNLEPYHKRTYQWFDDGFGRTQDVKIFG